METIPLDANVGPGIVAEKAQYGIVSQLVVVDQILVAKGEGHDALGHQCGDGVCL